MRGLEGTSRRRFLRLMASTSVLPVLSGIAAAQSYPTRPVRLLVGFAAGTAPDIIARLIAQSLSERLGQQVIVDNRPGAASNIATEMAVRASPDGYSLLLVTTTNAVNGTLYDNLGFSFVRDIAPVAGINRAPNVMEVNPSFPARTVPDFIAYARANPGKINFGSAGTGSASHIAGELFKMTAGIDMLHVPYRGNYLPDPLSGQIQAALTPIQTSVGYIRAGQLRGLAVTSATRSDALPDLPTVGEFVPGYEATVWTGIAAPKGIAGELVELLNKGINAALADPDLHARIKALGALPMPMTADEFGKLVADETEKWGKVVRAANIRPD